MAERLTLAARPPFDAGAVIAFLAARAVAGVEHAEPGRYIRSLRLPHGHGVCVVTAAGPGTGIDVELALEDPRDRSAAADGLRDLFDLEADPAAIDDHLGADPLLGPLVAAVPGLRVPGSVDPFETAVRAIIGQQISTSGARTITARLVAAAGEPLRVHSEHVDVVFPSAAALAAAPDAAFAMPRRRAATIVALAAAVRDGELRIDAAVDREKLRRDLQELPGIGPWTVEYICMRGLGDPDAYLPTDLGVIRALRGVAVAVDPEAWRPWRAYALHHLWSISATSPTRA